MRAAGKWYRSKEFYDEDELDLALAVADYLDEISREHFNGPDIDKDEKKT